MRKVYPVIISTRASKQFGRGVFANEITSMYAKEREDFEQRWKAEGLLSGQKVQTRHPPYIRTEINPV